MPARLRAASPRGSRERSTTNTRSRARRRCTDTRPAANAGPRRANGYVAPNSTTSAPSSRAAARTRRPTFLVGKRERSGWRKTANGSPASYSEAPSAVGQNTPTRSPGKARTSASSVRWMPPTRGGKSFVTTRVVGTSIVPIIPEEPEAHRGDENRHGSSDHPRRHERLPAARGRHPTDARGTGAGLAWRPGGRVLPHPGRRSRVRRGGPVRGLPPAGTLPLPDQERGATGARGRARARRRGRAIRRDVSVGPPRAGVGRGRDPYSPPRTASSIGCRSLPGPTRRCGTQPRGHPGSR